MDDYLGKVIIDLTLGKDHRTIDRQSPAAKQTKQTMVSVSTIVHRCPCPGSPAWWTTGSSSMDHGPWAMGHGNWDHHPSSISHAIIIHGSSPGPPWAIVASPRRIAAQVQLRGRAEDLRRPPSPSSDISYYYYYFIIILLLLYHYYWSWWTVSLANRLS